MALDIKEALSAYFRKKIVIFFYIECSERLSWCSEINNLRFFKAFLLSIESWVLIALILYLIKITCVPKEIVKLLLIPILVLNVCRLLHFCFMMGNLLRVYCFSIGPKGNT